MKRKYFVASAALLLTAPLALLSACASTPELTLSSNWFSDTSTKSIPPDFEETLEYSVSFEKSADAESGNFRMEYPNGGTYTTTLKAGDKNGTKIYVYTTTLKAEVRYSLGNESAEFPETVTTQVEFLDISNRLRPLSSTRTVDASAPLYAPTAKPASLNDAFNRYHYETVINYNDDLSKAEYTIKDLSTDKTDKYDIKLNGKGSFFDNEQILLLFRAAELNKSMTFRTLDPTTRTVEKIVVKEGPSAVTVKKSVKLGDSEAVEREINANTLSIAYNKANAGATQTLTYAQRGDPLHNEFRNVLLTYSYPVIYSHGTMTYQLVSANFYG